MRCPFCNVEKDDSALVCASCGRDATIPQSLMAERTELLAKRDRLRAALADATVRLAKRRGRTPRAGPA